MKTMFLRVAAGTLLAGAVLLGWAAPASAHPMPSAIVSLDATDTHVSAHIAIPLTDLSMAMGVDPTNGHAELDSTGKQKVTDYLGSHIGFATP
ncbi:MAG: hypothetical protein QM673_16990, partial [Gordonia sp. (in: high G+C Gram-positive bacteria)]